MTDQAREAADQPERTAMAWDRTGLALMVAGALFLRAGGPPYQQPRHLPGVLAIAYGAALIFLAYRRYARLRTLLSVGGPIASARLVLATGVFSLGFGAAALGLIVFDA